MPKYFFAVRGTAGEKDDPHGTVLPNDAAALSYAERTIAELQKEEGYDDPGMITDCTKSHAPDGLVDTIPAGLCLKLKVVSIDPTRGQQIPHP